MEEKKFNGAVSELLKGMDGFLTSKTVVGDAVKFDDGTYAVPLMEVSFGVGAGSWGKGNGNDNAGGGFGGKMSPCAVLLIKDGYSKVVSVKEQDAVSKILDMVPDVMDKLTHLKENMDMKKKAEDMMNEDKKEENEK